MINVARRAERAWQRIRRNPSAIQFVRPRRVLANGTVQAEQTLAPQLVRVESDNRASLLAGLAGNAPRRTVIVYGLEDHPSLPDTDVEEGYLFIWNDDTHTCVDVLHVPGEKQAIFEVVG